jgi:hypothetical protein
MVRNLLLQVSFGANSDFAYEIPVGIALVYSALSITYSVVALSRSFGGFAPCRFAECRI